MPRYNDKKYILGLLDGAIISVVNLFRKSIKVVKKAQRSAPLDTSCDLGRANAARCNKKNKIETTMSERMNT